MEGGRLEQELSQQRIHSNNFNIIKMLAAIFVVIGHTGPIIGKPSVSILGIELHTIGVQTLFLVGGYTVSKSWRRDPRIGSFYTKRFIRLWPPYAVMIVLMTFITGPALSSFGKRGYFGANWTDYLKNLIFYIIFAQPGVFTDQPMPNVTNGSLWTMPVEAALYVVTPILFMLFGRLRDKEFKGFCSAIIMLCVLNICFYTETGTRWIVYATDWVKAGKLMVFYLLGMLCSYEEMKKVFSLQRACVLLFVLVPFSGIIPYGRGIMMQIALPYLIMSLALEKNPKFSQFGRKNEISYGVYLYGFFFQQLVCSIMIEKGYELNYLIVTVISLCLTICVAWISSICIEKPLIKKFRTAVLRPKHT